MITLQVDTQNEPLSVDAENGTTPVRGLSAYEVAVANGFTGTEAQWLSSLKGEKGDSGEKGDTGENGATGQGVPSGGAVGQILCKASSADYDTQWKDPHSNFALIEKIIVGYSVTTEQPEDWATNYTDYFTNTGTAKEPVYTALTGASAPAWAAGTYYAFSTTPPSSVKRTNETDGTTYRFSELYYDIVSPAHTQSSYISCDIKCTNNEVQQCRHNLGVNTSISYCSGFACAEKSVLYTIATMGATSSGNVQASVKHLPFIFLRNGGNIKQLHYKGTLLPGATITIYGVRA